MSGVKNKFLMSTKNASKFKIIGPKMHPDATVCSKIPFFPTYETEYYPEDTLRILWFQPNFSQSWYNFENYSSGSNACTIIAVLVAAKCHYEKVLAEGPEKPLNNNLIYSLAVSMLEGNNIHEVLKQKGLLSNINLTVPEAIAYSGRYAPGITEWRSVLYLEPLSLTLFDNIKKNWVDWLRCSHSKHNPDLYVVLISDARSVIFIMQHTFDMVILVDSHQHATDKGALMATVKRPRLKVLCSWFGDIIYKCYKSKPKIYELSFLYFHQKKKSKCK